MLDKKDLRGAAMLFRDLAQLLTEWADDLERSFQGKRTDEEEGSGSGSDSAPGKRKPAGYASKESAADEAEGKTFTLPEVRAILAEKCAAGFGTQVKSLIESYGAYSLREVPAERYGELLEAVKELEVRDAG